MSAFTTEKQPEWKDEKCKPPCSHLWFQKSRQVADDPDNPAIQLVKLTHECPKCHYLKTTIRKRVK